MCAATASATSGSRRSQPVASASRDANDHARRGPDVGHQVLAVGLEGDAVLPAADADQDHGDREIDRRRRDGQRKAEYRRVERARLDQPRDGGGEDAAAASTMSAPSIPAAKYSALEKP